MIDHMNELKPRYLGIFCHPTFGISYNGTHTIEEYRAILLSKKAGISWAKLITPADGLILEEWYRDDEDIPQ